MTYDEIAAIDTEPFDGDTLDQVYCNAYSQTAYLNDLYASIVFRYFQKFDETYGTGITTGVDFPPLLLGAGGNDDVLYWVENANILLSDALSECGWFECWIYINDMEFDFPGFDTVSEDSRKLFHEAYMEYLDKLLEDSFLKTAFIQEEDQMISAKECLEEGDLGIIWNPQLSEYLRYREKNEDIVKLVCPDEDSHIMELEREVWEPYYYFYAGERNRCGDSDYYVVILGFDGYNSADFYCINPNWINKAAKLKFMLDLAQKKLAHYQRQEKIEQAA